MPVGRQRVEALRGRTADLIGSDGTAIVVTLGPIEDVGADAHLHIQVLAVECRGTRWRVKPGQHTTVPIGEVEDVRPVVFLGGPGL